ncbi:MAG: serine protease, partial [Rhodococcus sp. (in: high G+C Gram-positive bacteria)]
MKAESIQSGRPAAEQPGRPAAEQPGRPAAEAGSTVATAAIERPADAPRLEPRPVYRPAVDPSSARIFGRPSGTAG